MLTIHSTANKQVEIAGARVALPAETPIRLPLEGKKLGIPMILRMDLNWLVVRIERPAKERQTKESKFGRWTNTGVSDNIPGVLSW